MNRRNGYVLILSAVHHTMSDIYLQHVHMHQHVAHPPHPEHSAGVIDSISDTLLNAFSRVRKPDERFLSMREGVDKFEEGIVLSERLWNRVRSRTNGEYAHVPPRRHPLRRRPGDLHSFCVLLCLRLNEMAAPIPVKI